LGSIEMTRLRLEYFDQNEGFAACLPRSGRVIRPVRDAHDQIWSLVELDQAISYQVALPGHFTFHQIDTECVLLRSRWVGHSVGDSEPTSVFIVLVEPKQMPLVEPIQVEAYHHVAWGMCHTEQDAAQQGAPGDRSRPAGSSGA
jgi:hypothetical protein